VADSACRRGPIGSLDRRRAAIVHNCRDPVSELSAAAPKWRHGARICYQSIAKQRRALRWRWFAVAATSEGMRRCESALWLG